MANYIFEVKKGDFDNDGWEDDVVIGDGYRGSAGNDIRVFNESASQLWSYNLPTASYVSIGSIDVNDINGDGNVEIVAGNFGEDFLYVLNRTGGLVEKIYSADGLSNSNVVGGDNPCLSVSGDADGDGIYDVASMFGGVSVQVSRLVKCTANFNDSNSYNMTWNNSLNKWQMNRTFTTAGDYRYNITCEKGGYVTQTEVSTLSIPEMPISHEPSTPYANYTKIIANFTESSATCKMKYNKTGIWSFQYNMSWNASLNGFEAIADNGYLAGHMRTMPIGTYYYKVTCTNNMGENVSSVNQITVQEYATSLAIENDTSKSIGEQVNFYANYTSDSMRSGVGLNRNEIGQVIWNSSDLGDNTESVAYFDCEVKGKRDCVVVIEDGDLLAFYANGTQISADDWPSATPVGPLYSIKVDDLDNDGHDDIILADQGSSQYGSYLRVFYHNGTQRWATGNLGGWYGGLIEIVDTDGDGKKDIVFGFKQLSVAVYNYSGDQLWNVTQGSNHAPTSLSLGDFDSDGIENDILVSTYVGMSGLYWIKAFYPNGTSRFNITSSSTTILTPFSTKSIDLDKDGFKNEIVSGAVGYIRTWNITGGNIWTNAFSNNQHRPYKISIFDYDNDGYESEILANIRHWNGGMSYIFAYDNNSNNLWNITYCDGISSSISVEDITNDGDKEIILDGGNNVVWVLNKSGDIQWTYNISHGNTRIGGFSDINNDGINEIAVASNDGYAHILQDVTCKAYFNDSNSYNMTWDVGLNKWQMNRTFATAGNYGYNITCEKGGYVTQVDSSVLRIQSNPQINTNATIPATPLYRQNMIITSDITDEDNNIIWVNFTLKNPSGIIVIDHENGTNEGDIWNSSTYLLNESGLWQWWINASDTDGRTHSSSGSFVAFANCTYSQFNLSDSHGQLDRILNPNETYNATVKIQ